MKCPLLAMVLLALLARPSVADEREDLEFFENKVRPVLVEHCVRCHGPTKQKGGLRLDSKAGWEKGGDNGRAILPGKSKQSLLIKMVSPGTESPPQMPPSSHLSASIVADLTRWIDLGAPDPRNEGGANVKKGIDWDKAADYWAYQPVKSSSPPVVKDARALLPIDRFVQAKLEQKGLIANARADKRTLLRRATYDLIGLPPTRDEVEAFLRDDAPDAFATVVERLLTSPHYGEHQARMWLDVARYAEDQAYSPTGDLRPHAWRYRDWVIDAFNEDMPYDRFVQLQIAADLLEKPGDDPKHKAALGFFGLGPIYYKNNDMARGAAEEADDRLDTMARGLLGLTVSCARCHDHKYDPIPTQDYYSLAGVFYSTKLQPIAVASPEKIQEYDAAKKIAVSAEKAVKDHLQTEKDRVSLVRIAGLGELLVAAWDYEARKLAKADYASAEHAKLARLDKDVFARLLGYVNRKEPSNRLRNEWAKLRPLMGGATASASALRQLAEVFGDDLKANLAKPYEKRNLDLQQDWFGEKGVFPITEKEALADASVDRLADYERLKRTAKYATTRMPPDLPLAHGVVESKATDLKVFVRGNPYTQGELAPRRFLRVIAGPDRTSFKAGSGRQELAEAITQTNNPLTARVMVNRIWQGHFGRGIVATASNFGELGERPTHPELLDYLADRFMSQGWSIKKLHREIMLSETYQRGYQGGGKNQETDPDNRYLWRMNPRRLAIEAWRDSLLAAAGQLDRKRGGASGNLDDLTFVRRTVYGKVSRHDLSALLRLFDFPDANITSERRNETTVPQQMLFVMNSPFMIAQAKALASRLEKESTTEAKVGQAYWLTLARPATVAEIKVGTRYLDAADATEETGKNRLTRLERYAQNLLASNEFVFVD